MKRNTILLKTGAISVAIMLLSGCAQKASSIQAMYVSPVKYENYSCKQLGEELNRINHRVNVISGEQDKTATKDVVVGAVGAIVFWPALFLLAAGDDQKEEISRLKGEYEAIRNVSIRKKCRWASQIPSTKQKK